jgi:hypothetical protein
MKTKAVLLKLEAFIEFLFLKLAPLVIIFFAHLHLVNWTEGIFNWEDADYPWIAAMLLTLIPLMLIAGIFHRTVSNSWKLSKWSVIFPAIILLFIGTCGSRALMQLNNYLKAGHHTAAIYSLQEIHKAQMAFKARKNTYATLQELAEAGLIDSGLLDEKGVSGYRFFNSDINSDTFCIHANRVKNGMGNKDFHITESGEIRFIKARIKGTVPRGQGTSLFD